MFASVNKKPCRATTEPGGGREKKKQAARSDMKILLQSVLNRLYFRRPGVWTADPNTAHDFERSQAVFDFVDQQNLHDVQLVVKAEAPSRFEVVPLELPARTVAA
jgi:hypothetical protein